MSKAKLDEDRMLNELRGQSAFFPHRDDKQARASDAEHGDGVTPGTETPAHQEPTSSDAPPVSEQEVSQIVSEIRRAVRQVGKEAATYRFTPEEKRALSHAVYAYKGQGVRTSENEVTRIAVNWLLEDYRQNGENSMLAHVLRSLNE